MRNINFIILVISGVFSVACQQQQEDTGDVIVSSDSLQTKFARGFSAVRKNGSWALTIHAPYPGAKRPFNYLLVPRDAEVPRHNPDVQIIHVPVEKLIATSTTHIPLLDYLNATDALVGFPNPDYISSRKMRQRIDSGKVKNIGIDQALEPETVLSLEPEMIMSYAMSADLDQLDRLRQAGIPFILNADYLEAHPLGRAEWIKVAGLLLGKEKMADSIFNSIDSAYSEIAYRASGLTTKPTAFSGVVYGDTWFMPGGENYAARLMQDAGIDYLWRQNASAGFLELSFEAVLNHARYADFWIGVASFKSLEEMASTEPRYRSFKAFETKNVYSYNRRIGETGGYEYLELGYLRPDLILGDLLHIAHPDILPGHTMFFYRKLQ